jgi:hypothetical protein
MKAYQGLSQAGWISGLEYQPGLNLLDNTPKRAYIANDHWFSGDHVLK